MSERDRPSRLWPLLELVRIQLTPTAVADSFTGYCLASAVVGRDDKTSVPTLLLLALSSVAAYWSGMISNDWFDREKDVAGRKNRPIARGSVTPTSAAILCIILSIISVVTALIISTFAGLTAVTLLSVANLYNGGGKRVPIAGNLLMGICRTLNLFLGAAAVLHPSSLLERPEILVAGAILGLYVAGVTAASVLEDRPHVPGVFLATTAPLILVPLTLALLPTRNVWAVLNSVALGVLLVKAMARGYLKPRASPSLHPAEEFVRAGLSNLLLVDAGILLSKELLAPAISVYGLMILAWLWRRRWLQSQP